MANVTALGTDDVRKLLISYSFPAIIAMMASSLYNIIDSIFIGHGVGSMAISGLAVTFPLMNLLAAFGSLIGAGGASLVSIKLGERDTKTAGDVLGNVFSMNILLGLIFTLLGIIFLKPILSFFGASYSTMPYAYDYMFIILSGNVVTHLYLGLNNIMRSSGYPRKAMLATLMTVVVNCMLDPLFIFVFKWGIRGAAIATVLAQSIALVFVLVHFSNSRYELHFKHGIFLLRRYIVKGIFSIGMAPFMVNISSCLVVVLINHALYNYGGDLAIGAYGIINRIMMLFGMLVLGFTQGMQPIVGYNFGAKQFDRMRQALKLTICYATIVMFVGFIAGEVFPRQIAMMFTSDESLIDLAVSGMRIAFAAAPVVGFQMVVSNLFQSIGKASKAVFLSSTRQLLFLVPMLLILPHFMHVTGVWLSMPVSDVVAAVLAAVLLFRDKSLNIKEKLL